MKHIYLSMKIVEEKKAFAEHLPWNILDRNEIEWNGKKKIEKGKKESL